MNTLPPVDRPLDEGEAVAAFGAMLDGGPALGPLIVVEKRATAPAERDGP